MDALNIEKVSQSFTAFRQAAWLDDHDHLLALMNALADSGQAGEGGAYEDLSLLLAARLEAHDRRASPVPDDTLDTRHPDFAQECQRQCQLVAKTDSTDVALQSFMDGVPLDDQAG